MLVLYISHMIAYRADDIIVSATTNETSPKFPQMINHITPNETSPRVWPLTCAMERGDAEQAALVAGETEKKKPNWSRFGLSSDQQKDTEQLHADPDEVFEQHNATEKNELFREDQVGRLTSVHLHWSLASPTGLVST